MPEPEKHINHEKQTTEEQTRNFGAGRFTKEEEPVSATILMNPSPSDQKFYRQDISGSIAHVTMLAEQGILTEEDRDAIIAAQKLVFL